MGKTAKGKAKARAKVAKSKAKIARKAKACAIALVAFGLTLLTGCATSDSAQPAKSQTQNNTFEDCIFVVATKASVSNLVVSAEGTQDIPAVELFTQTQSLESTGSTDSFAQTSTQTPTTDVKPDVTANYAQGGGITNRATGDANASGAAGILEKLASTLTDDGLSALKTALVNKLNGTVTLQKKDGTTTTADCKDGACTFSDGTTVTQQDCEDCVAK